MIDFVLSVNEGDNKAEIVRFRPLAVPGPNDLWYPQVDVIHAGLEPKHHLYIDNPYYHEENAYVFAEKRAKEFFDRGKDGLAGEIVRLGHRLRLLSGNILDDQSAECESDCPGHPSPGGDNGEIDGTDEGGLVDKNSDYPTVSTYEFSARYHKYTLLGFDWGEKDGWIAWVRIESIDPTYRKKPSRHTWTLKQWEDAAKTWKGLGYT